LFLAGSTAIDRPWPKEHPAAFMQSPMTMGELVKLPHGANRRTARSWSLMPCGSEVAALKMLRTPRHR
jgi:hypothetical protein